MSKICKPCDCIEEQKGVGFKLAWFVNKARGLDGRNVNEKNHSFCVVSKRVICDSDPKRGGLWVCLVSVPEPRIEAESRRAIQA